MNFGLPELALMSCIIEWRGYGTKMIKEYINKLSDENRQDLEKLEKQMKDLLQELSCAEEWSESLQIQNNSQRNIFSPRNVDTEIESKIEKTQLSIQKIRKEIEYVRDLIETHIKKKEGGKS